jgi:hypothetical protein
VQEVLGIGLGLKIYSKTIAFSRSISDQSLEHLFESYATLPVPLKLGKADSE